MISDARSVRLQLYNFGNKLFCLEFCILILGSYSTARVSAFTVNFFADVSGYSLSNLQ